MGRLDSIWNHARADLVIPTSQGEEDILLWEHSARVARTAQLIARLPVVQEQGPDQGVLLAAALYHDAGWIVRFQAGEVKRAEILARPPLEAHRELGAALLQESLAKVLPRNSLERAAAAVRVLNQRRIEPIEGQVVAEAESLDEFGMLSLWPTIHRRMTEGKGVQAVIDTWKRQKEYQFWAARLHDAFRFAPIQQVAEKRLAMYECMMSQLEEHHNGNDLEAAVATAEADKSLSQ